MENKNNTHKNIIIDRLMGIIEKCEPHSVLNAIKHAVCWAIAGIVTFFGICTFTGTSVQIKDGQKEFNFIPKSKDKDYIDFDNK